MKRLALAALLLSSPAFAGDLSIVVLKQGDIVDFNFSEVSRTVVYTAEKDEKGEDIVKWVTGKSGQRCVTAQATYPNNGRTCTATLTVVNQLKVNGFTFQVNNVGSLERQATTNPAEALLTTDDLAAFKATDYSDSNSSYLSQLYDVNAGTVFGSEHHFLFKKQLRLYVDSATKKVLKLEFVSVALAP